MEKNVGIWIKRTVGQELVIVLERKLATRIQPFINTTCWYRGLVVEDVVKFELTVTVS